MSTEILSKISNPDIAISSQPETSPTLEVSDEIDIVAAHDFYKNKVKAFKNEATKDQITAASRKRLEYKEKALNWKKDGRESLKKLHSRVTDIRLTLEPHLYMRRSMQLLIQLENEVANLKQERKIVGGNYSQFILACIKDANSKGKFFSKKHLILHKIQVLNELKRTHLGKLKPWEIQSYRRVAPITLFRFLHRYYGQNISIPLEQRTALKKKRAVHRAAVKKLKLIHDTQASCLSISNCKSWQHFNEKGCPSCGVIFMGGSLDGAIPYVKSVSRDTGVPTLVTLEFELETLSKEETIQLDIVNKLTIDLEEFESVIYAKVRAGVQPWWSFVLCWKDTFKRFLSHLKSSFYYRVRRLVCLKREIDVSIREPAPLDMQHFENRFCDLIPELHEYIDLQHTLKTQRILKWTRHFFSNLMRCVYLTRERNHQEWLRLQSLPKPEKPIVLKSLAVKKEAHYVCYRGECQLRNFLTEDRYNMHMAIHFKEDKIRHAKYAENERMRLIREEREKQMLVSIKSMKISDQSQF